MNDEIKSVTIEGEAAISAWTNVFGSYASKKYLREGETRVINRIKDYLNITVTTIVIITAIVTAVTSVVSIYNNRKEIENLKQQLAEVKEKLQHEPPTKK